MSFKRSVAVLGAVLAFGVGGMAFAQAKKPMHPPMGLFPFLPPMEMAGEGDSSKKLDGFFEKARKKLEITSAQETAFHNFEQAVKVAFKNFRDAHAADIEKMHPKGGKGEMPLPDRLELHARLMKDHLAAMEGLLPTFRQLYEALSPEQKSKLDRGMGHHGPHKKGEKESHGG